MAKNQVEIGKPYTPSQGAAQAAMVNDLDLAQLVGWWSEPDPAPAQTATLNVGQGLTSLPQLLLRANLPSTVTLQGPKDLLFRGFGIKLTARSLVRNLAKPQWGSSRSITGESSPRQEILLAAPARVTGVGVRFRSAPKSVKVEYKEATFIKTMVASMDLSTVVSHKGKTATYTTSGYHQQAVVTDSIRFDLLEEQADLLVASPSLPSRVGVAIGDDTPAQIFPNEMELNGTLSSRDLTGVINAAWKRGVTGATAQVQLRITSLTDGVVQLDLTGAWGRLYTGQEAALSLDTFNAAGLQENWPFDTTVPDAEAWLNLTGRIEGGRRLGLVSGAPTFYVRTTERLEVAQAFRIAAGDTPVEKRELLAVWLMVPSLPKAEAKLEIRLCAAISDPAFPADEPLARLETALPVDAAAYVAQHGVYWYRAALEKPVPLDGTQAISPLFVVVAGREGGSLLAHRSLGIEPTAAQRVPDGAGAGVGLVRNLDRTGQWEVQSFSRQAATWLVDLELAPTPAEYPGVLAIAYGSGALQALPLDGSARFALETARQVLARPASGSVAVTVASALRASVTAQLSLYKPIRA